MNEDVENLSKEIIKLLHEYEQIHINTQIQALLSIAISIAYQFVDKGKEKDYIIKTVANKLDFFEKNYDRLSDLDCIEDDFVTAFKVKSK